MESMTCWSLHSSRGGDNKCKYIMHYPIVLLKSPGKKRRLKGRENPRGELLYFDRVVRI